MASDLKVVGKTLCPWRGGSSARARGFASPVAGVPTSTQASAGLRPPAGPGAPDAPDGASNIRVPHV
jgi:hypothetical protein